MGLLPYLGSFCTVISVGSLAYALAWQNSLRY